MSHTICHQINQVWEISLDMNNGNFTNTCLCDYYHRFGQTLVFYIQFYPFTNAFVQKVNNIYWK